MCMKYEVFEQGIQKDVFFGNMAKAFDVVPQPFFIREIARLPISMLRAATLKTIPNFWLTEAEYISVIRRFFTCNI